jgi:DNA-directed RNA polymerase subunit K/omega
MNEKDFTKYERARILGARALQIAMNAPLLIKIEQEDLEKIQFDALKIAEIELNSNILPISIKKPFPARKEEVLKRAKEKKISDEQKEELEAKEVEEIAKEGEIMELANPEDEQVEEVSEKSVEE